MLLRLFARDSAIYGGADIVSKAIAFVTFPLVAAALSPLAFGALELLVTATALLGIAASCGLSNSVQRFYWDTEAAAAASPVLVSSGLAALSLLLLAAVLIASPVAVVILPVAQSYNLPLTGLALASALVLMAASQATQYLLDVTRLQMKPWRFFGVALAARVLTALAAVLTVVWLGWGLDGLLVSQAIVAMLALSLAALAVRKDLTLRIDARVARMLMRFGYPFVYAGLAFWLLGSIDRWMLAGMSSVQEVGIYSVAYRFASVVMLASVAFAQAWSPIAMKMRTDHPRQYRRLYADVLLTFACGMLVLGGAVALFSEELIHFIMPPEYFGASLPLAVLSVGVIVQSTTHVTAIGITIAQRTSLFARLSWMTAGLNCFLNLILIPLFGAAGAAGATALAYLFLTGGYLYYSQRLHPIPISWHRVGIWTCLLGAIALLSGLAPSLSLLTPTSWMKFALLAACVGVCYLICPWRRMFGAEIQLDSHTALR